YFLYYEDVDFCMRVSRSGYGVYIQPEAVMWHKNAQSTDFSGSAIHVYYQTRNRLLFGMRYSPFRTKVALIRESIRQLSQNTVIRKAVIDFYTHRWGKQLP
ncbi:hypothetical protein HY468_04680, partial [Candidatus Roizmanbacteria bacterium]|nr:hypothetical protein [Candidatus Roizmanbacteria bacterium]